MTPVSVNRGAVGCCWAWQAGRREGSRSRRHHEPPPASLGLLWGPGNGLSENTPRQQVFPHLFLTAELEVRPPPDTVWHLWAAQTRDTTRSPRGPALSCDERIAASTSGGKQSLSELATAPLPSPGPSGLHPGWLLGRGFPSGSVTPGTPPLRHLFPKGTSGDPSPSSWRGRAVFLKSHHAPGRSPCAPSLLPPPFQHFPVSL